jgi:regulator of sigma E protease
MIHTVLSSTFFFILTLGILITFHEFGHFWVARRLGVKVLRFSVGFGKPLWSWRRGADNTEYVIAALPLGGYVKMVDEREGEVAPQDLPRAFNRQPLASRAAIVAAGPFFNFFLAIGVYWLVFMLGVVGMKPIVGQVEPGSIAAQGGFEQGDEIVAVAGTETRAWNNTILTILDRALSGGSVDVQVKSKSDQVATRTLDLTGIAADLDQGNLMDMLGIQPARLPVPPVIGQLESGGPAMKSGLQTGDRVVRADGEAIPDWGAWVQYVRARPDQDIQLEVERDGQIVSLVIHPARVEGNSESYGRIGAGVQQVEEDFSDFTVVQKYGPLPAMGEALAKTWNVTILTLRMLYKMIVGEVSVSNLSGPISIAQYAGGSASIGLVPFLTFLAIVSVSLGVLNLLPIPILDGGHLLYYLVEMFKGSPVSQATEILGQKIGIVIILGLMVFAFYNDLLRIFG